MQVGVCSLSGITFIWMCCSLQGVVCTLHEGDDFGKLALVNDAPRAASIVLREDNCHFLRVDKEDFNRIDHKQLILIIANIYWGLAIHLCLCS